MKFLPVLVMTLLGLVAAECPTGYYSGDASLDTCNFACSEGCKGEANACDAVSGVCVDTSGCNDNWKSASNNGKCDVPMCFGKVDGCAEGGKCVAPNHCVCGESGAQIVAKYGEFPADSGNEGYNCVSLRKDGIFGAGLALIVVTVSISICGGIERSMNKKK